MERTHYKDSITTRQEDAHNFYFFEHFSKSEREGVPTGDDKPTAENYWITKSLMEAHGGNVSSVTSLTTGQLTVADSTTTPKLSIVTGAVASGSTDLVTAGNIYNYFSSGYVPYTGASANVDLGDYTLDTKRILQSNNGGSIFIGEDAGLNDDLGNNYNLFAGYNAGKYNTSGDQSVAIGAFALENNITSRYNTAVGYRAASHAQGKGNTALGNYAGAGNIANAGEYNTSIGQQASEAMRGSNNVSLGYSALRNVLSTSGNTGLGTSAGQRYGTGTYGTQLTSPTNSIFIGYDSRSNANSNTNEIVIGANAIGNGSNTATIGDDNVTDIYANEDGEAFVHLGGSAYHALTNTEILAIATPLEGMLVWNTTTKKLNQYNGSMWEEVTSGAGGGTVTSVAVSGSDGIEVDSGSPITTNGTIALGVDKTSLLSHINVADGASVSEVSSGSPNQLSVATGTSTPVVSATLGNVGSGLTNLCTSGTIYNYLNDTIWVPSFAEGYVVGSGGLAIGTINTWTPISGWTVGINSNLTTTTSSFTIIDDGVYNISVSGSFEYTVTGVGTTSDVRMAVFINSAEQTNMETLLSTDDGKNISFSISGLSDLSTSDVVTLSVRSDQLGTFTIGYGNINLKRIGFQLP